MQQLSHFPLISYSVVAGGKLNFLSFILFQKVWTDFFWEEVKQTSIFSPQIWHSFLKTLQDKCKKEIKENFCLRKNMTGNGKAKRLSSGLFPAVEELYIPQATVNPIKWSAVGIEQQFFNACD